MKTAHPFASALPIIKPMFLLKHSLKLAYIIISKSSNFIYRNNENNSPSTKICL